MVGVLIRSALLFAHPSNCAHRVAALDEGTTICGILTGGIGDKTDNPSSSTPPGEERNFLPGPYEIAADDGNRQQ